MHALLVKGSDSMSLLPSPREPKFINLGSTLSHSATRNPGKPAILCGGQVLTYRDLDQASESLALWFLDHGLQMGDRIAIHWCNSCETVTLFYACFKAGLIAVPLNNRLKSPEIAYILQHSSARLCFSQPELAPAVEEIRNQCPDLLNVYTELPQLSVPGLTSHLLPEVTPDRVAAILYTSGTTARPKGVMHSHLSLLSVANLTSSLGLHKDQTLLAPTQMVHIAALGLVLLPGVANGSTVVLLPMFDAAAAP
jgi:long-chain acyl-CoA synthetase